MTEPKPAAQPAEDVVERVAMAILFAKINRGASGYRHLRIDFDRPFPGDYDDALAAIAALRPRSEREEIVAWLRKESARIQSLMSDELGMTDMRICVQLKIDQIAEAFAAHRLASTTPSSEDKALRKAFCNGVAWERYGVDPFEKAVAETIAALRPRSEREEIVAWLRTLSVDRYIGQLASVLLYAADAIERGDFKESGE